MCVCVCVCVIYLLDRRIGLFEVPPFSFGPSPRSTWILFPVLKIFRITDTTFSFGRNDIIESVVVCFSSICFFFSLVIQIQFRTKSTEQQEIKDEVDNLSI